MPKAIFIPRGGYPGKPTVICPYCGTRTTLTPIEWTLNKWIGKCDAAECGRELFANVEYTGSVGAEMLFKVTETFPKYTPPKGPAVPDHIWDDFSEAHRCFDSKSFKATVMMCRRTVQNISKDKGASKKDSSGKWIPLREQIKTAFPGAEFRLLRKLADEIKFFGDYGAHPNENGIDAVTEEEAKEVLEFTQSIIEYTYVLPERVKRLADRRKP